MIITLDGPAGSGKSTISRKVAGELAFNFLDTGAMYRCVTLEMLSQHCDVSDSETIKSILNSIQIQFQHEKVLINGVDCSKAIRSSAVDHFVSPVSQLPIVRESMTSLQRKIASGKDFVTEGRDMGTVVFPDAQYKFFLDADVRERARRRFKQLRESGTSDLTIDQIELEIRRRDEIDSSRDLAPLKAADDAHVIDTSKMSIEQVIKHILSIIS